VARVDLKNKAIQAKLVYYGPGLCGKTTNLQYVNEHLARGQQLMSLSTEGDRTIFFDFMPLDLGKLRGMDVQFKLYTVPGQVRYNETRKMVLKNVDGVVFVADSQEAMLDANLESFGDLMSNLQELGIDHRDIAIILQYNKRDLPNVMSREVLDRHLNEGGYTTFLASAASGTGVVDTLREACKQVLGKLSQSMPDSSLNQAPSTSRTAPKQQAGQPVPPREPPAANLPAPPALANPAPVAAPKATAPAQPKRTLLSSVQSLEDAPTPKNLVRPGAAVGAAYVTRPIPVEVERQPRGSALAGAASPAPGAPAPGASIAADTQTQTPNTLAHSASFLHAPDGIADTLAKLSAEIAALRAEKTAAGSSAIASDARAVEQLMQLVATKDDVRVLAERVGELPPRGELTAMLQATTKLVGDLAAALGKLSADISGLQRLVAQKAASPAEAPVPVLEGLLRDVAKRSDQEEVAKRLAAGGSAEAVERAVAKAAEPLATRSSLEQLAKRLEAARSGAEAPDPSALAGKVMDGVGERFDELRALLRELGSSAAGQSSQLTQVLERLDVLPTSLESRSRQWLNEVRQGLATEEGMQAISQCLKALPGREDVAALKEQLPSAAQWSDLDRALGQVAQKQDVERLGGALWNRLAAFAPEAHATAERSMRPAVPANTERGRPEGSTVAPDGGALEGSSVAPDSETASEPVSETASEPVSETASEPVSETAAVADVGGAETLARESPAAPVEPPAGEAAREAAGDRAPKRDVPPSPDPQHQNAARIARVMVNDLYLYQKDAVDEGIRNGDFHERNKDTLQDMRLTYESRVPEAVRAQKDFLEEALQAFIAKKRKQLGFE
jgi:hypothetical protein